MANLRVASTVNCAHGVFDVQRLVAPMIQYDMQKWWGLGIMFQVKRTPYVVISYRVTILCEHVD